MTLPIGSVVSSVLSLELFQKYSGRGEEWVFADGEKIPENSKLREIVKSDPEYFKELFRDGDLVLPDLRGVFLRGTNGDRVHTLGDPRGNERSVGSYQADAIGPHSHDISPTYPNAPNAPDLDAGRQTHGSIGWDGYPRARTGYEGTGIETRPRNVAVNYFIRIS